MFSLQQLQALVYTAKVKRLSAVAEMMNVRQPTVHFHLDKLEQIIGAPLFIKESHRITRLTDTGKIVLEYAEKIVRLAEELQFQVEDLRGGQSQFIKIGSTYTPATYMLPELVARFKQSHPKVDLHLEVKPAHVLINMIRSFELDFALLSYDTLNEPDLKADRMVQDDLVLIMHPGHELAQKESISLRDLHQQQFVMHEKESTSRRLIDDWRMSHNLHMNILMEVSATETMKEVVKKNIGMAIVSETSIRQEVEAGQLTARPLPMFANNRYIYLIHHRNQVLNYAAQVFYATVSKWLGHT